MGKIPESRTSGLFRASIRRLLLLTPDARATQLLFNGCPIGHIKEILGHDRLDTTCRYYLGLDHRAVKQAHERYLIYDPVNTAIVRAT